MSIGKMGTGSSLNIPNSAVRFAVCLVLFSVFLFSPTASSQELEPDDDSGCKGGTCPFPVSGSRVNDYSSSSNNRNSESGCGLWMAPSPIKQAEDHSFGLGIFTGKAIPKGTPVEASAYGHGELLLPIYHADAIYDEHPPLREFIWDEDNLPESSAEYPYDAAALFVPGLASIAPCTSENYNLRLGHDKGWSASTDDGGVHRSTHPQAGAFSYRHNVTYIAVRDIAAGEELTVDCDDDSFDGGAYYLTQYDEKSQKDDRVTCLDQNLRVGIATQKAASDADDPMGLGLFAKRNLAKGENIISSPLTPIHRDLMELFDDDPDEEKPVNNKQLMLNYVFGHPDSDLLLLPIGPMVNFINHRRASDGGANAEIRWHHLNSDHIVNKKTTDDLKAYHDTSLFDLPGDVVALTHGRGLVMDIVALREISEGEEVYLDYGIEWQDSWDAHTAAFQQQQPSMRQKDRDYWSAENYSRRLETEFKEELGKINKDSSEVPFSLYYHTEPEEEELMRPYPENIEFYCFYHTPDNDDEEEKDSSSLRRAPFSSIEWRGPRRYSWNDHSDHDCFRPCSLMNRYPNEASENDKDNDDVFGSDELMYSVMFYAEDGPRVTESCWITDTASSWLLEDVPQSAIRLLDSPYTTDALRPSAFRHEIGVPVDFYPEAWMVSNVKKRLRASATTPTESSTQGNYKLTKQQPNKDMSRSSS